MTIERLLLIGTTFMAAQSLPSPARADPAATPYVRLAELEIDPAQLDRFKASVDEEIQASIRLEPGVLALYAVALVDQPSQVRVFEMYKDAAAYASHLETPHFRKFKAETQGMVRSMKLFDAAPITLGAKTHERS